MREFLILCGAAIVGGALVIILYKIILFAINKLVKWTEG